MPDNSRLAKLIEQRKRQEKNNDRIRVHKNKLDHMRLEKLSSYYDRNKQITRHLHLTAEAKCVKSLEKIYHRQCKIEDEKKERENQIRREGEKQIRLVREGDAIDDPTTSAPPQRRRVRSASRQERARNFMKKAKSLSSGYRDNDPPQSYYKRNGLVPPDRAVTPEISFSAQAQTGGGFLTPASALHVQFLRRWHGIPDDVPTTPLPKSQDQSRPRSAQNSPSFVKRQFSITEALRELDGDDNLEVVREETESRSSESIQRSSVSGDAAEDSKLVVNIRPSTAPAPREKVDVNNSAKLPMSARDPQEVTSPPPTERGILLKTMLRRPSTALPAVPVTEGSMPEDDGAQKRQSSGICFADLDSTEGAIDDAETEEGDTKKQMRRTSSAISFAEVPKGRRRSSVAPPLALLHRRQSNVAAIQRSIERKSRLLKPKSNRMKRKSGARMGLMQSVMTNVENENLTKKLKEKSECLAAERERRLQRAQSAPAGGRQIQLEEDCPNLSKVTDEYLNHWTENHDRRQKNKGQRALIEANVAYSERLSARVSNFLRESQAM